MMRIGEPQWRQINGWVSENFAIRRAHAERERCGLRSHVPWEREEYSP
jgi:hypothetical protein